MTTTLTRPAPPASPTPMLLPARTPAAPDADGVNPFPVRLRLPDAVIAAGPDACESWFVDFTLANSEAPFIIELNANGELELTMPPYEPADEQESEMHGTLYTWNTANGRPGRTTSSSGAYRLSNGAIRYPDAAWTAAANVRPRPTEPPGARPYCPDFVVEIRSPSQSRPSDLSYLRGKMREYMDSGAKLGWLIDPLERTVRIYRTGVNEPELLLDPERLDGEDVLPGFVFAVRELIFDLA